MWKLHAAGLITKFKLLIVFFQAVLSLKDAYTVDMPPGYDEVMTATFSWAEYNKLSRLVIPGGATACLVGGFYEQLLLVGGVPLAFCVGLFLLTLALEAVLHFFEASEDRPAFTTWQAEDSTLCALCFVFPVPWSISRGLCRLDLPQFCR